MAKIIQIVGFSASSKVPGAKWKIQYGQGLQKLGARPRYLLLIGNKTTGSIVPGSEIRDIFPNTDIGATVGLRSELAQMYRVAKLYGVRIKMICVAEASGGAAAAGTITIVGTASTNGVHRFYMVGKTINANIASGMTATQQAAAIVAAFGADPDVPVTAANTAGVVTLTAANVGARGNEIAVYYDPSGPAPGTATVALAGGASVNPGENGVVGVRLGSGSGVDDVTAALAALQGTAYFTIAAAQNDVATNAPLLEAYADAKSAFGVQLYEQLVLGYIGDASGVTTLAKTTLNHPQFKVAWQRGAEATSAMLAASFGAMVTLKEQEHPNRRYVNEQLLGIPPQRALVDRPSGGETGEQDTALNNGYCPVTSQDGVSVLVKACTTFCVRGGVPFYGTTTPGQSRTPQTTAEALSLFWDSVVAPNNEYVDDDPAQGEDARPPGVITPSIWQGMANNELQKYVQLNWFSSVSVEATYDDGAKCIRTAIDMEITPTNDMIAGNLNQGEF